MCSVNASARNGKSLLYSIPCSYLSMCFAVIAKNICEVKLQRSVVRRQAGRPDRELKQEVEVHHYRWSELLNVPSIISTTTCRFSRRGFWVPLTKRRWYFHLLFLCFGWYKHSKKCFCPDVCRKSSMTLSSVNYLTCLTTQ